MTASSFTPTLRSKRSALRKGASTYVLDGAPDTPNTITRVKIGDFVVPVTAAGELWLYVSPDTKERYISASKVLATGDVAADIKTAIEGSIVFVGTSAAGLQDVRTTALGENVPGVSVHAQIVEQFFQAAFFPGQIRANGLEILSIAVLGSFLVILTTFVTPAVALACGLLITFLALAASWIAFVYAGLLFDPAGTDRRRIDHAFRCDGVPLSRDRPGAARRASGLRPLSFTIAALSHRTHAQCPASRGR